MSEALVIRSTGSTIGVLTSDGATLDCHIKGNLRLSGIRSTNPVAVGDRVTGEHQPDGTPRVTPLLPPRSQAKYPPPLVFKTQVNSAVSVSGSCQSSTVSHSTLSSDRFSFWIIAWPLNTLS